MTSSRIRGIALVLVALGPATQLPLHAATERYLGKYVFVGPKLSEMVVRLERGRYVVVLAGGADPSSGPATSADCYVRAVGKINAGNFSGRFAHVENDVFSYSERRAQAEQRVLKIEFRDGSAKVTRADVTGYCGLGADFVGLYRREQ